MKGAEEEYIEKQTNKSKDKVNEKDIKSEEQVKTEEALDKKEEQLIITGDETNKIVKDIKPEKQIHTEKALDKTEEPLSTTEGVKNKIIKVIKPEEQTNTEEDLDKTEETINKTEEHLAKTEDETNKIVKDIKPEEETKEPISLSYLEFQQKEPNMYINEQIRVLTLNDKEHQDSTLYRLNKNWILQFRLGPSLLGRRISLYTNYPEKSNVEFKRTRYQQLKWNQDEGCKNADDTASYAEIVVNIAGSFHYYFTYEDA